MNPRDRSNVLTLIGKATARLQARMTALTHATAAALTQAMQTMQTALQASVDNEIQNRLATTPRRAEFTLTSIATGTGTTQAVTWLVPIAGDYAVVCPPPTAAAVVLGLVTAGVQAGSKTATGCTLVIANRTGAVVPTAAFDVLAFPL